MAYVSQELKAKLAPTIKAICKKYGVKATLSVRNHSSLVLTVKQGSIDFGGDRIGRIRVQRNGNVDKGRGSGASGQNQVIFKIVFNGGFIAIYGRKYIFPKNGFHIFFDQINLLNAARGYKRAIAFFGIMNGDSSKSLIRRQVQPFHLVGRNPPLRIEPKPG